MSFLKFAALATEAMLEAVRNFQLMAFHRINWVDKRMTALALKTKTTMHETDALNSLRNVVIVINAFVNTADPMECRQEKNFSLLQAWFRVPKKEILKTTVLHKTSTRINTPYPKFMI